MHSALIRHEMGQALRAMRKGEIPFDQIRLRVLRKVAHLKASGTEESWAEEDAALPIIEALAQLAILGKWHQLRDKIIALLGLTGSAAETFTFDHNDLVAMLSDGEAFAQAIAAANGPLTKAQVAAWTRGTRNAAADLQLDWNSEPVRAAISEQLARVRLSYAEAGLALVRGGVARQFRDRIVASLAGGEFDGMNPLHVARELRARFGGGDYNWIRLARSEVVMAQASGKKALMLSQGVEEYDYTTAGDNRVSEICQSLAAAGPYRVVDPSAPVPVRDSHPQCRCTIVPVPPK